MINTKVKKTKILLVDDEPAILNALGFYLELEGYGVEALSTFKDYLAGVTKVNAPDIIVLDILLNGEDGVLIAKKLKSNLKTKHIPIVMISALPDGKAQAAKAGVEAFLAKPFDVKELNRVLKRFV